MSIDLGRALRDVVDGPTARDERALGGPGGLARLRGRVRRARTRRAAARASVGGAAAIAIGVGGSAVDWSRLGGGGVDGAASPAATADPREPVSPSGSALCGADLDDLASGLGDLALRLGMPGSSGGGELVGRSLGPQVPVWVTADGPVVLPLRAPDVVLVRDGVVVAVADDAARLVAGDAASERAVADLAAPAGSGALRSCPGADAEGLAGAVPSPGDYTLVAVAALVDVAGGEDDAGHVASPAVDVTLLPEEPPLTDDPGLPADFPLADVPIVGDAVLDVVTGGLDGWKVTVGVTGTDALQRAAAALGVPGLPVTRWDVMSGEDGTRTPDEQARAATAGAAISADRTGSEHADLGGSSTSFSLTLRGYDVEVTEQPGPGGRDSLVYRVTR